MTIEVPRQPFNPTWLTVGSIILSGVISGAVSLAVTSRDVADLRHRQDATDMRTAQMERRMTDEALANAKVLVALQKDMESANKALEAIRVSLGSPRTTSYSQSTP